MGDQLPETVLAVFMAETKSSLANVTAGVTELKADNREMRMKMDAQDIKLNAQSTHLATLEAKVDPMSKFMWLLIGGGTLAFLTSVASLVMVVRK